MRRLSVWGLMLLLGLGAMPARAGSTPRTMRIRDIAEIQGVRENQLIGYGLVVGLQGTGDRQQTYFTVQTLANTLQRLGVQIPAGQAVVKNVAAVMVTAKLPAFADAGMKLDVTVSSVGDAKSLEGGVLLLTALRGADGTGVCRGTGAADDRRLFGGGERESSCGELPDGRPCAGGRDHRANGERGPAWDEHGGLSAAELGFFSVAGGGRGHQQGVRDDGG